jgi:hypothetical protein
VKSMSTSQNEGWILLDPLPLWLLDSIPVEV